MTNSLTMLIHSFEVVFIHKPRAIFIIYTSYFSFNPVAVKDEVFDSRNSIYFGNYGAALNFRHLGPVVQGPISANPGFNFNPGFYISLFKSRFGIILPIVFRAFTYLIVVKKK